MVKIKFGIVFQVDGLNIDEVLEDLKNYGEITEVMDNELDSDTPVKVVFLDSDFRKFIRFKWDYNAVEASEDYPYLLFPMNSMEAKMEVIRARK